MWCLQVIADFFTEWCGPCKMIAPFVEDLSTKNPEIVFLKVDVATGEVGSLELGCMPALPHGPKLILINHACLPACCCVWLQDVSSSLGISAMPTFLVFVDEQKVAEQVGASKDKLTAMVAQWKTLP